MKKKGKVFNTKVKWHETGCQVGETILISDNQKFQDCKLLAVRIIEGFVSTVVPWFMNSVLSTVLLQTELDKN